jgi:GNAT superfamily N-acetyltransferase
MNAPGRAVVLTRKCTGAEFDELLEIINDSARAYSGVIPDDCMHEPYMSAGELAGEISDGVEFWCAQLDGSVAGIMGIQYLEDVTLIRHAYVRTARQNRGIGSMLIKHLKGLTGRPLLVGTWRAAGWAVRFYEKHGFRLLDEGEHAVVLNRYWKINPRQVETSVVLADEKWFGLQTQGEL